MRLFRYVALAALYFCAQNVSAQQAQLAGVACEGCTFEQMQERARSEIDIGGVVVFSVSTGDIRKFIITWDTSIIEAPIDRDLEDYFVALVRFWHENGQSLEMNYDVATDTWLLPQGAARARSVGRYTARASAEQPVPGSVYEALQSPARMNNAIDRLNASWIARGYVAHMTFINSIKGPILAGDGGRPVTTMNFADGSKIKAAYDKDMKSWAPIPGSGRDLHGNTVPQKKEDFAKDGQPTVYEFPGGITSDAYMDFSRYAFDMGIRLDFTPGDIQMICTSEVMDADMRIEVICMGRRH
jgi:hypothetical protein